MVSYEDKILKALALSSTVDDIVYIREKIQTTDSINRRTNAGRELTDKLLGLVNERYVYLVDKKGMIPF